MKKRSKIFSACALAVTLAAGAFVSQSMAANVQPGSASDPVVTKSYVDERINQLTGGTYTSSGVGSADREAIVSDVMAQIEYLYGKELKSGGSGGGGAGESYEPVSAAAGQVILGHEGTEIILRSGTAVSYCPGANGITDTTDGVDLTDKKKVSANHLIIVPREDGRGVLVQTDAWFLIKGGYDILTY